MKPMKRNQRVGKATRPTRSPQRIALISGIMRKMLILGLLLSLGWVGISLWERMDQPVREVVLTGQYPTQAESEIRASLAPLPVGGVLSLDLVEVRQRLAVISWIERVSVRRQWPDTLVLDIHEHQLLARWQAGGYLSASGVIVSTPYAPEGLPLLSSSATDPSRILDQFLMLDRALSQTGFTLTEAHQSVNEELTLVLKNGIRIELGNKDLLPRLQRLLVAWKQDLARLAQQIAQIDARYVTGLAVQWKQNPSAFADKATTGDRYGELAGR